MIALREDVPYYFGSILTQIFSRYPTQRYGHRLFVMDTTVELYQSNAISCPVNLPEICVPVN